MVVDVCRGVGAETGLIDGTLVVRMAGEGFGMVVGGNVAV